MTSERLIEIEGTLDSVQGRVLSAACGDGSYKKLDQEVASSIQKCERALTEAAECANRPLGDWETDLILEARGAPLRGMNNLAIVCLRIAIEVSEYPQDLYFEGYYYTKR